MKDKAFKWYACAYLGCNHQLYGRGVNLYCDEHRTEAPKGQGGIVVNTAAFKDQVNKLAAKFSDEEIAELEMENQYLREQLAEAQDEIDHLKVEKSYIESVNAEVMTAYGKLLRENIPVPAPFKTTVKKPEQSSWDPAGIRWSGSSPTGRRPDGTTWYTKSGHTYWSPPVT